MRDVSVIVMAVGIATYGELSLSFLQHKAQFATAHPSAIETED